MAIVHRCGLWLMAAALGLAAVGIFFSDPSGQMPEKLNLFRFAMRGLEVQLFRTGVNPPRYLVNVLARDWLLGCLVMFAVGAILFVMTRRRMQR